MNRLPGRWNRPKLEKGKEENKAGGGGHRRRKFLKDGMNDENKVTQRIKKLG